MLELDKAAAVGQHCDRFLQLDKNGCKAWCIITQSLGVCQHHCRLGGLKRHCHTTRCGHEALQEQAEDHVCTNLLLLMLQMTVRLLHFELTFLVEF